MTVYDFESLPSRFDTNLDDGGFIPNPIPGAEFPEDQRWSVDYAKGHDEIYPLNLDFRNGWVASVMVDGGYNRETQSVDFVRDAKLCFQIARLNQQTGEFIQGSVQTFTDFDTYQFTTSHGTTEMYSWQPYTNLWSLRNKKSAQSISPGRCAFVMPSDDGNNSTERRADHLWLFIVDCDDGVITYTRHLIFSATESVAGIPLSVDKSKRNIEWGLQVIDGAVVIFWTFDDAGEDKSWMLSRVFDLDSSTVGMTRIVMEEARGASVDLTLRIGWSIAASNYTVLQFVPEYDWAPRLVVMDDIGAFVSTLSLSAESKAYGAIAFTFLFSGLSLVKIDDSRCVLAVMVDHSTDGRAVVLFDLSHNEGVLSLNESSLISDATKTIVGANPTAIGMELLPGNRIGVFTYEWETYNLPVLHFFIVETDITSWVEDGELHMTWSSDFAGGLGVGPAWGQHINGWWTYVGRERVGDDGTLLPTTHKYPLAYYTIGFETIIPPLRLKKRDDHNKYGSPRLRTPTVIQGSSKQSRQRIATPNTYW